MKDCITAERQKKILSPSHSVSGHVRTYLAALAREAEADDVITLAPLLKAWHEGKYEEGDIVNVNGVPYRCLRSHESAENPGTAKRLWAAIHAKSAETALPYSHDQYKNGEYMIFKDGRIYRCVANGADKPPDAAPFMWETA